MQRFGRFNFRTTSFATRKAEKPTDFTLDSECRISLIKIIEHQPVLNALSPRTSEVLQSQQMKQPDHYSTDVGLMMTKSSDH